MNNQSQYHLSYFSDRKSRILDYGQTTDQLYDPLRGTISRASRSPYRPSTPYKPVNSKVSQIMHQLTPQKANQMVQNFLSKKATTFIPVDKKLVPTNHLYKVRGKRFQAIDTQEHVYQPISAEQMQQIIEKGRFNQQSQTVYQFQDEAIQYDMYSYKLSPNYRQQFKQSQYYLPLSKNKIKTQPCIIYNANQTEFQQANNFNSMDTYIQQLKSPPNYSFNPSYHASRCVSQQNLQAIRHQPYQIQTIPSGQNITSRGSYNSLNTQSVSRYSFKDNIDRKPVNKPKSKYQYNLFSALDFAVNSGCKGCGGNQIIAKTPSRIK